MRIIIAFFLLSIHVHSLFSMQYAPQVKDVDCCKHDNDQLSNIDYPVWGFSPHREFFSALRCTWLAGEMKHDIIQELFPDITEDDPGYTIIHAQRLSLYRSYISKHLRDIHTKESLDNAVRNAQDQYAHVQRYINDNGISIPSEAQSAINDAQKLINIAQDTIRDISSQCGQWSWLARASVIVVPSTIALVTVGTYWDAIANSILSMFGYSHG